MSKLLRLKEWLTLDESADHLSSVFQEDVSVVDIYRFALNGHLQLSANFMNKATASLGKKVHLEEAKFMCVPRIRKRHEEFPAELPSPPKGDSLQLFRPWLNSLAPETREKFLLFPKGIPISKEFVVEFDNNKEVDIVDLWDLSMVGAERLDVEHALQKEIGGPGITLINMEGVLVYRSPDIYAKILEDMGPPGKHSYFPAGRLPDDSSIVVRVTALLEFVEKSSGGSVAVIEAPKPDWGFWANMELTWLDNAIVLACDIDPGWHANRTDIKSVTRLKGMAESHVKGGMLAVLEPDANTRPPGDHGGYLISLSDFRKWGESLPTPIVFPGGYPEVKTSVQLPSTSKEIRPLTNKNRTSFLRIIDALSVMAKIPDRGAAVPIEAQLRQLGYDGPDDDTIRKILKEVRLKRGR